MLGVGNELILIIGKKAFFINYKVIRILIELVWSMVLFSSESVVAKVQSNRVPDLWSESKNRISKPPIARFVEHKFSDCSWFYHLKKVFNSDCVNWSSVTGHKLERM